MPLRSALVERQSGWRGSLYRHRHWPEDGANRQTSERQTASLAGIVVILVLLIGGLFLVQQLRTASQIEDCLLAGRRNCDSLVPHSH
jgi:hypothetical protein